jgi:hypothetical protein
MRIAASGQPLQHARSGPAREHLPIDFAPCRRATMNFALECAQEGDARLLAEVPESPGALACGETSAEAMAKAEALALRVLAD